MCRRALCADRKQRYALAMRTILLLTVLAVAGADVYRWVDSDGQVHFSDTPRAGAERITIQVPQPRTSQAADQQGSGQGTTDDDDAADDFAGYDSLTIQSPGQDETLWNIEGQLNVAAAVQPELQPDHTLQVYLDGQALPPADPGANTLTVSNVYRGQHSLRAVILDSAGAVLAESPTVSFYVRQNALGPKNTRARP